MPLDLKNFTPDGKFKKGNNLNPGGMPEFLLSSPKNSKNTIHLAAQTRRRNVKNRARLGKQAWEAVERLLARGLENLESDEADVQSVGTTQIVSALKKILPDVPKEIYREGKITIETSDRVMAIQKAMTLIEKVQPRQVSGEILDVEYEPEEESNRAGEPDRGHAAGGQNLPVRHNG